MTGEVDLDAIEIIARDQFTQDRDLVFAQSFRCEVPHAMRPPRRRDHPIGMLDLERIGCLRVAHTRHELHLADPMVPKQPPACGGAFRLPIARPSRSPARPIAAPRMIDRRQHLAGIGRTQGTARDVPPDGVDLAARFIDIGENGVAKTVEGGFAIRDAASNSSSRYRSRRTAPRCAASSVAAPHDDPPAIRRAWWRPLDAADHSTARQCS